MEMLQTDADWERVFGPVRTYRKPNTYISPFVLYNILIPQLETFLQRYGDESFDKENENANDSWQWTVEEARRLYMELNSNK